MVACPGVGCPWSAGAGTSRGGKLPSPPCGGPGGRGPPSRRGRHRVAKEDVHRVGYPGDGSRSRPVARRLPVRGGHGRIPGRGRVQRTGRAGQQLAGLGAGRPGRAVRGRRRLLGAAGGGPRPGGRPRVRQLPAGRRVGPGGARRPRGGRGGPRPLRVDRGGVRRAGDGPAGDPAPLHPSGLAGRGPLAPPRRPGPLRRMGPAGGPGPRPVGPPLGHPQRAQHPRRPDVPDRRLPARADGGDRRRRRRPRPPAGRPRAGLRRHPRRAARRRGDHQQLLPVGVRVRPAPGRPAAGPQPRRRAPGPRRVDRRAASGPLRPAAHARDRRGAAAHAPVPASPPTEPPARGSSAPRRALDALEASPHERTLDVLGVDYYDPLASRHSALPGHRTAGGRNPRPSRELWDDPPDPAGLDPVARRPARAGTGPAPVGGGERAVQPAPPRTVVRPAGRLGPAPVPGGQPGRGGGRRRRRRARRGLLALVAGRQLRVGILRTALRPLRRGPRPRGPGGRWLETDAMGRDSAGAYRSIIAGLRAGDRTVLDPR